MTTLVNVKEFTKNWKESLKTRVAALPTKPTLGIVRIGNDPASERYVRNKIKDCEEVGLSAIEYHYEEINQTEFTKVLLEVQRENRYIIIQQPLPKGLYIPTHLIDPIRDIDAFLGDSSNFKAATPFGIMYYLINGCGWNPEGKNVCIIGRGNLVGKPMAKMMTDANATVTLCHSYTKNLYKFIIESDLVVCAVGRANFLNCKVLPKTLPIIDVGINFTNEGKMIGDCYYTEGCNVTPVPGGVGLLTRCAIIEQMVKDYEERFCI